MHGWQGLLLVTIAAVIVGTPWVRVAVARDQAAVIRELRAAAIVTVLAVGVAWAAWVFGSAHAIGWR